MLEQKEKLPTIPSLLNVLAVSNRSKTVRYGAKELGWSYFILVSAIGSIRYSNVLHDGAVVAEMSFLCGSVRSTFGLLVAPLASCSSQ